MCQRVIPRLDHSASSSGLTEGSLIAGILVFLGCVGIFSLGILDFSGVLGAQPLRVQGGALCSVMFVAMIALLAVYASILKRL